MLILRVFLYLSAFLKNYSLFCLSMPFLACFALKSFCFLGFQVFSYSSPYTKPNFKQIPEKSFIYRRFRGFSPFPQLSSDLYVFLLETPLFIGFSACYAVFPSWTRFLRFYSKIPLPIGVFRNSLSFLSFSASSDRFTYFSFIYWSFCGFLIIFSLHCLNCLVYRLSLVFVLFFRRFLKKTAHPW